MKKYLPLLSAGFACIVVAGCTSTTTNRTSILQENINPLVAERYGNDLADQLADLIIQDDPVAQDPKAKEQIQREIAKAKAISRVGKEEKTRGQYGSFIAINEDAFGEALLLDGELYLSSTFETEPGPALHIYLTKSVDPREGVFPDESALDLGEIQSAYGAQTYALEGTAATEKGYRTVVLYDATFKRIFSFAQLPER